MSLDTIERAALQGRSDAVMEHLKDLTGLGPSNTALPASSLDQRSDIPAA